MTQFDWSMPYPSRREGVLARNIVATSQPLAAQAGLSMMQQGGNAIDAAIATAIALTVVEPTSNGIGSDAFALVWAGGGLHGLNASGLSPARMLPGLYEGMDAIPTRGWGGVTVPGAVSAWAELSKKFGVLPFEKLFEPAIYYASRGYHVSRQTAHYWEKGFWSYGDWDEWNRVFAPGRTPPIAGALYRSHDHAKTLESIASSHGESFYRGKLAEKIIEYSQNTGGILVEEDLAEHQAEWVRPISVDYHDHTVHEIPPNGQGIVALLALGILRHLDLGKLEPDSARSLHLQIEAMKLAFADGHAHIADPRFMQVSDEYLLDDRRLKSLADRIDSHHAQDFNHGPPKPGGTVYLTTADAHGNMVSYIQSNYTGFGSGIVVPGAGIALQNRGCCFTLQKGHPNEVGPRKRPYHTIIPGFVTDTETGDPVMSFGVMGGYMQPQGHAQVLVRLATYNQNPQAMIDAPRWQVFEGLKVRIEPGFDKSVYDDLLNMGHELEVVPYPEQFYGRGQAIHKQYDGGYFGASDGRADGMAVGF